MQCWTCNLFKADPISKERKENPVPQLPLICSTTCFLIRFLCLSFIKNLLYGWLKINILHNINFKNNMVATGIWVVVHYSVCLWVSYDWSVSNSLCFELGRFIFFCFNLKKNCLECLLFDVAWTIAINL